MFKMFWEKKKVSKLAGGIGEGSAGFTAYLHEINPPSWHNKELYLPIQGSGPGASQGISDIRCHGNVITRKRGSRWRGNPRDSLATGSHGNSSKLINNSPFPSTSPQNQNFFLSVGVKILWEGWSKGGDDADAYEEQHRSSPPPPHHPPPVLAFCTHNIK